jgi:protein kinase X
MILILMTNSDFGLFFSYPPWFDDNAFRIYEKIIEGRLEWPKHLDPVAK